MTDKEKKEYYYCSAQDFLKRFKAKNYTELNEALIDSMRYIARFNMDPKSTKCDLSTLLYVAKNEIVKLIAKMQLDANEDKIDNIRTSDDGLMVKSFIADPAKATAYYFANKKEMFDGVTGPENEGLPYNMHLKENANSLSFRLKTKDFIVNNHKFTQKKTAALDLFSSLEAKLPDGDNPINEELKRQKPNVFENLLGRTSKEYTSFLTAFNNYRDPDSPLFGYDDALKTASMNYIKHKFPNLKEGELPSERQINALGGKAKPRVNLCLNIINAINEKERLEDKVHDLDVNLKYSVDKYPWDNNKTLLDEELEKQEQMENEKLNANNELEYDPKYNQLEVHDAQNIFH